MKLNPEVPCLVGRQGVEKIVDLSRRYCQDAQHYLKAGDFFTSLVCVAYSEGLLDSLRMLNLVSFEWRRGDV